LVNYHKQGGKLLLVGELPIYNQYQEDDTTLIDYFKVKPLKTLFDWEVQNLSLVCPFPIKDAHEFRTFYAQTIESPHESIFNLYPSFEQVGFMTNHLVWVTSSFPGDPLITKFFLDKLEIKHALNIEHTSDAAIFSSVQGYKNEKFIHVMNLDYVDYQIKINYLNDDVCNSLTLDLFAQDAYMIPLHMSFKNYDVIYSTAELFEALDDQLTVRLTQRYDEMKLRTTLSIKNSNDYDVEVESNDVYIIHMKHHAKVKMFVTIYFN
jgi:hypothetical protein